MRSYKFPMIHEYEITVDKKGRIKTSKRIGKTY